jgi:hypothetical protein
LEFVNLDLLAEAEPRVEPITGGELVPDTRGLRINQATASDVERADFDTHQTF